MIKITILVSNLYFNTVLAILGSFYNTNNFSHYDANTSGISSDVGTSVAYAPNNDVAYTSSDEQNGGISIGIKSGNNYNFTAYNSGTATNITSGLGTGAAFDQNNTVAYVSQAGGLSVGVRSDDNSYSFINYESSPDDQSTISNDWGTSVAFRNEESNTEQSVLAYVSHGGGLDIGTASSDGSNYTFVNYSAENNTPNITNDNCTSVAFDASGDVVYGTNGGGIFVGVLSNSTYTFTPYNSSNTSQNIVSDDITGVAFDKDGNIACSGLNGGLSIGVKSGGTYNFTPYSAGDAPNQVSDLNGTGVAFDKNDNLGYVSESGLDIGN